MSDNKGGGFVFGLLIGAIAGGIAALALAPQPGRQTRQQLMEKGIELRGRVGKVGDAAEYVADVSRQYVDKTRTQVQDAIEEGKQAAEQARAELMGKFRQAQEDAESHG